MQDNQAQTIKAALVSTTTQAVIQALGGDEQARFVGGCVRNVVRGAPVNDIDIATIHPPDTVLKKLERHGIKALPTGIKHGTVTAVIDETNIEITTLRFDIKTDGRHAEVSFTQDWLADAQRRDFTMNTLLADTQGRLYDPLGQGLTDAKAGHVRFVGDAQARIQEDYLRILRFFRFQALYGKGAPDQAAVHACEKYAGALASLSRERVTQEFTKLLTARTAASVLHMMADHNILSPCFAHTHWQDVERFYAAQDACEAVDLTARLYALRMPAHVIEATFALPNAAKRKLARLHRVEDRPLDSRQTIKEALYSYGREVVLQAYLLKAGPADKHMITLIRTWDIPACPITGTDLIAEGYREGAVLGAELKRREEIWIKKGFNESDP